MKRNKYVYCEYKEGFCYIVLDRNPSNSMNSDFLEELYSAVDEAENHLSHIKAVFIHGSGRHFSSGAELENIKKFIMRDRSSGGENKNHGKNAYRSSNSFMKLNSFSVPVVALIRGVCIGSGFELALAAHIRIAEENSILGLPEITWNLIPGCGGTIRFTQAAGIDKASRYILTGELFTSQDGLALGVIDRVVPKGEVFIEGNELAKTMDHYSLELIKKVTHVTRYA